MSPELAAFVLDAVLASTLVVLGWRCTSARDRFESVALFIGLGAIMAIAWTRLAAPDLAIAEAALGAGIIGALLLAARVETRLSRHDPGRRPIVAPAALAAAVMAVTAIGIAPLFDAEAGLAREVVARVGETGVTHPVTAVLVDFRVFDTLLELCVLLAALVATWQLGVARPMLRERLRGPVFLAYARMVIPLLVVLAGALLWRGASAPCGAFQAGAVLAAAGVVLLLSSPAGRAPPLAGLYRIGASLGVVAFLGLGLLMAPANGTFLDWPQPAAGALVLAAEAAATLAIGFTLALLVIGGHPGERRRRASRSPGSRP
jgi:multisubunit Na+/H+ antiporter MnhB subunit